MSEETILKNSIIGGYNKKDVISYIDSVSEANDKKAKDMKEQIVFLTKENSKLKKQLAEKKRRQEVSEESSQAESKNLYDDKQAHYSQQNTNNLENVDRLPVRQQMELPEGTYVISKDHSVINLPEPFPSYQTKEKSAILNSAKEAKKDAPDKEPEDSRNAYENAADKIAAAEQIQDNKNVQDISRMESAGAPDLNEAAADTYEEAKSAEVKSAVGAGAVSQDEMQAELTAVKALLAKEKNEKQMLAAKLEFCNDLLLQLYKK